MGCALRFLKTVTTTRRSGALAAAALALGVTMMAQAAEIVIYGFEEGLDGWAIPQWAQVSEDYVGKDVTSSSEQAKEGHASMTLKTDFPGGKWTGAYVERQVEVTDWTPFGSLSVDIFVPADAPTGLQGKVILTVGDQWKWTEMNRAIPLTPGAWTTITVNLKPGSMDWSFFPDEHFRASVRKIGVRVESNDKPVYSGPIYIDNIRLAEQ